jgi:hypothetical protein
MLAIRIPDGIRPSLGIDQNSCGTKNYLKPFPLPRLMSVPEPRRSLGQLNAFWGDWVVGNSVEKVGFGGGDVVS